MVNDLKNLLSGLQTFTNIKTNNDHLHTLKYLNIF